MNILLQDTLRFLTENFDPKTSWTIPPSQAHLKKPSLKRKETPHQKVEPLPSLKQEEAIIEPFIPEKTSLEPLRPIIASSPLGVESLSDAIKGLFPGFTVHTAPPQDKDLKVDPALKKLISAEVVLFSFREGKESDLFLQNICLAISSQLFPAAVLDAKKREISGGDFDLFFKQAQAKVFIASETLYKKPMLRSFLKEIPISSEKFLSDTKLILLKPFEIYFTDPTHKKELWKTICASLKKSPSSQASS